MLAEHPAALRILMNEDLYLNLNERAVREKPVPQYLSEEPVSNLEGNTIPEFIFIGKNQQNFLILTTEALQENHLKALESTLLRKQMVLDDVAIVDCSAYENSSFEQFYTSFMPQKLVCFGLKPGQLALPETLFNTVSTYADCKVLFTYGFTEMLGNKEKTKAFWEPMKNL